MHSASEHATIISAMCQYVWPMQRHAKSEKNFEAARLGVFAIPGPPLAHLNCGIRVNFSFVLAYRRLLRKAR